MMPRGSFPPVPAGFRDTFIAGGWKAVERRYGASTPVLLKWMEASGGDALKAERAAVQPCGPRSGGAVIRAAAMV